MSHKPSSECESFHESGMPLGPIFEEILLHTVGPETAEPSTRPVFTEGGEDIIDSVLSHGDHDDDAKDFVRATLYAVLEAVKANPFIQLGTEDTPFDMIGNSPTILSTISAANSSNQLLSTTRNRQMPTRAASLLLDASNQFIARYESSGKLEYLHRAICILQLAADIPVSDTYDITLYLNALSYLFQLRFESLGRIEDVNHAIMVNLRAISLLLDDSLAMPLYLNNLGVAFESRFDRLGNPSDLEDAISAYRRAVELTPNGDASKPTRMKNLGSSLRSRFALHGSRADIEDAVSADRQAVDLTADEHPRKPSLLISLGASLHLRYDKIRPRNPSDLEDAIIAVRRALDLTPDTDPAKPIYLNNLGNVLESRFDRFEDPANIAEAISSQRRAVDLTTDDSRHKPSLLGNLSISLRSGFQRTGDVTWIDEAIIAARRAVALTHDDHPYKPSLLHNLGILLDTRFDPVANIIDAEDFTTGYATITPEYDSDDAVYFNSDVALDKPMYDSDLASSTEAFLIETSDLAIIEEAIVVKRRAIELAPDSSPEKPTYRNSLGTSLETRFKRTKNRRDVEEALRSYIQAATQDAGFPSRRLRLTAARRCISLWWDNPGLAAQDDMIPVYACAMALLPQVAWIGQDVDQRYDELALFGTVVNSAAALAIDIGRLPLAIEWLEEGRSVVWNQLLGLHTPVHKLEDLQPELSRRFLNASRQLRRTRDDPDGEGCRLERFSWTEKTTAQQITAEEYERVLRDIRKEPGFEQFLLPQKLDSLFPAEDQAPVVIVNLWALHSDALIVYSNRHIIHVPLPKLTYELADAMNANMVQALSQEGLSRYRGSWLYDSHEAGNDIIELTLECLWTTIVQPVVEVIEMALEGNQRLPRVSKGLPHVTWCATGLLAFLPFHAAGIYDGSEANRNSKAFQRIISSYTPTMSSLCRSRNLSRQPLHPSIRSSTKILVVSQPETPNFSPLPSTREEAERVKTHFSPDKTIHLDGAAATVSSVLQVMDDQQPGIVHFACHGIQDRSQPADSAFMLDDGPLRLSSLIALHKEHVHLAFLSACQTATGTEKVPEETVHLAAALLAVGFDSVIGTMWSIADADAPLVADALYAHLMAHRAENDKELGGGVAHALHHAVRCLRDVVGERNFLRWIPFVHLGV